MLSYKNWKSINESFGGYTALGIKTSPTVGITTNALTMTQEEFMADMRQKLDEAKKKMKKKMGMEGEGDGEMVEPAAKKDADPDADAEAAADSEDKGGEEEEEAPPMKKGGKDKDKGGEEEPDKGGDEEETNPDEEEKQFDGDDSGDAKEFMKKGGKKGKKPEKKDKKESVESAPLSVDEVAWRKSVMSMLSPEDVNKKFWDGMGEPKAGEVGFAPSQRLNTL